jgi:hypothetical protein
MQQHWAKFSTGSSLIYLKPADKSAEILECGSSPPLFIRGQAARSLPAAVAGGHQATSFENLKAPARTPAL